MIEYLTLEGKIFPEIFLQYYRAATFYLSIAMMKKNNGEPEKVYAEIKNRLIAVPRIFENYMDLFDYNYFLENWQIIRDLMKDENEVQLKELYVVSRYEFMLLFMLIVGKTINNKIPIDIDHVGRKLQYQTAWENVVLILKDLGITYKTSEK